MIQRPTQIIALLPCIFLLVAALTPTPAAARSVKHRIAHAPAHVSAHPPAQIPAPQVVTVAPESVMTFIAPNVAYQQELRQHASEARLQLEKYQEQAKREPFRQLIAETAIALARQVEAYEALSQNDAAGILLEVFPQGFNDVIWRLGNMSQHGHAGASLALGLLNRHGMLVERDEVKACQYYALAAEHKEVLALYRQSVCLSGQADGQQAVLQQAAEQGHPAAQEMLGRACYEQPQKDMKCALDWLTRADAAGRASAQALLGWIYYQGIEVPQDYRKAYKFYAAAAISGDRFAQNNLGECYELGRGARADATRAFFWYRKAAEAGLPAGEFNLGRAYLTGLGTSTNKDMAKLWLVVSAQRGISEARQLLDTHEDVETQ